MWIQIHIDIDFTKLGATAFIISFLRLCCGAHLIHQPTADNVVEPLKEDLIAFMFQHTEMIRQRISRHKYFTNLMEKKASKDYDEYNLR